MGITSEVFQSSVLWRWITENLAGRKDKFANIELVLLVVLNSGVTAVGFPCISARIQGSHQRELIFP